MALDKHSRQQDRLELLRKAKAVMERPRPTLTLKSKTLHLPEAITLPSNLKIGVSFEHEGRSYKYAGDLTECIGKYRKRKSNIWKTDCKSCHGQVNTFIRTNATTITSDALKIECVACEHQNEEQAMQIPEAVLVWNDEKIKACAEWARR